jgi:hypothetical protein
MSNVYREMRCGQTAIADGTKLIFSLRCLRDVLEAITLGRVERRLDEIEGTPRQELRNGDPHPRLQ